MRGILSLIEGGAAVSALLPPTLVAVSLFVLGRMLPTTTAQLSTHHSQSATNPLRLSLIFLILVHVARMLQCHHMVIWSLPRSQNRAFQTD